MNNRINVIEANSFDQSIKRTIYEILVSFIDYLKKKKKMFFYNHTNGNNSVFLFFRIIPYSQNTFIFVN